MPHRVSDSMGSASIAPDGRSEGSHRASTSHLGQRTNALVLAGGRRSLLRQLTDHRAKPAVPFGGTMRTIDFALGSCVNSGMRHVAVLTQ